jgi:hypothetical protein
MPSFDDIIKSIGKSHRVHDDERLGRFYGLTGPWHLSAAIDLPFQKDVPISFQLECDTAEFPDSMIANISWLEDQIAEIWNSAAGVINASIESENISTPDHFRLDRLAVILPIAPLQTANWKWIVEVNDVLETFEVSFYGINAIACVVI